MGWESTAAVRLVGRVSPPPDEEDEDEEDEDTDDDEGDTAPRAKE